MTTPALSIATQNTWHGKAARPVIALIINSQEVDRRSAHRKMRKGLPGYRHLTAKIRLGRPVPAAAATPISYDAARLGAVEHGYDEAHKGRLGVSPARGVQWAVLRDRLTGDLYIVTNLWAVNGIERGLPFHEWRLARRADYYRTLRKRVADLRARYPQARVLIAGDANDPRPIAIPDTRSAVKPDAAGRIPIEQILLDDSLELLRIRRGPKHGSDHPTRIAVTRPKEPSTMPKTITRAQWGARSPRGGPGALTPSRVEGIALHWPAMSKPVRGITSVSAALRGWQNNHMDDPAKRWSDIAYQEAVDQDGNVYVLRGLQTQSGANGDNDVNERFGALLLILAPGEKPTAAMIGAVQRRVIAHRKLFPRSKRIVGHGQIRPGGTACPGPLVQAAIGQGLFEPVIHTPRPPATPASNTPRGDKGYEQLVAARRIYGDIIRDPGALAVHQRRARLVNTAIRAVLRLARPLSDKH